MTKEEIFELVVKHCREIIPELEGHAFRPDEKFEDLGANSMDRAEITMLTMEALDIKSSRVEFSGAASIGQLVELFHAKL